MASCDKFRYWISLDSDARLEPGQRPALTLHVNGCVACQAFISRLKDAKSKLRENSITEPGGDFTQRVIQAAVRPAPRVSRSARTAALVAAGVLILLAPLALTLRHSRIGTPSENSSGARDRMWLLFTQFANEEHQREADTLIGVRRELEASGLGIPLPADLLPAGPLFVRLQAWAGSEKFEEGSWRKLREDMRASGLLEAWYPKGLPVSRPGRITHPGSQDLFRLGRRYLYEGAAEESLARLREFLIHDPDSDLRDDALFWIAFIEARLGRETEALGALYSLCAFETDWLSSPALDEAQRLAIVLAARKGINRMDVPVWSTPEPESTAGWNSVELTAQDAWCAFQALRPDPGGKNTPVAMEIQGKVYRAPNPAEFRRRWPDAVRFLEANMPEALKVIDEGLSTFQVEMPAPPPR